MHYSKHAFADGRRLLKKLLPLAVAKISPTWRFEAQTDDGRAAIPVYQSAPLEAVILYQFRRGWYADIVFDVDRPNNVVGTPMSAPLASMKEAQDYAIDTIAAILSMREPMAA
jgi:hypothetical protein